MSCFKLPVKSWLNPWFKHSRLIQCHASSYLWPYVMKLRRLFANSSGGREETATKSSGLSGRSCANQKHKGVWGLRIYLCSTMHFWLNKLRDYCMMSTLYFMELSSQNSFWIALWCRQRFQVLLLTRGRALSEAWKW